MCEGGFYMVIDVLLATEWLLEITIAKPADFTILLPLKWILVKVFFLESNLV